MKFSQLVVGRSRFLLVAGVVAGMGVAPVREVASQVTAAPPAGAATQSAVQAGRFDNGKMWTFEHPPTEYLRETYNFTPDSSWYARARLGALRIPGCSASLVSARGLVMTNHHCTREAATGLARGNENILDDGFYARADGDERRSESLYADQLIGIVDVTSEVDASAAAERDPTAAQTARSAAGDRIKERLAAQHGGTGIQVEIIPLWNGARTSAYVFRRYSDVRLVMTPELQIGYFGGDPDNFTYPRYAMDFTFLRIYGDDGRPLSTPAHFRWSTEGVSAGDLIFVIGNPGSTSRLQTVAQLEFRRDVQDAGLVRLLSDRVDVYQEVIAESPDAPGALRNELFGFLNAEKAYSGMLRGLRDPAIIARRAADEAAFRDSIRAKPELAQKYGQLHTRMERVQQQKRELSGAFKSLTAFGHPALESALVRRALFASQYVQARAGGAPAQALEGIKGVIAGVGNQPAALQEGLLAGRLRDIVWGYGAGSADVSAMLDGRSPEVMASLLLTSPLADSAKAMAAIDAGTLTPEDPAVRLGAQLLDRVRTFQTRVQQLSAEEEDLARELGRARFEVYGVAIPPDATFSLRIADGLVKGYDYNGTIAPAHTTLYGLFDRHFSHGSADWALPRRWLDRRTALQLQTPANFIATADIIGGNSGSPVLDRNLNVVGLVFDGNIESLPGDFIYMDERARAVAVDVRGILEALRTVYGADRIVRELTTGR